MTTPARLDVSPEARVMRMDELGFNGARALLARHGLRLESVPDGEAIPGSYWGESEAGLIGSAVFARGDTPVHSLLHEACHLIVMPAERRSSVDTDATDSIAEEDAACYLQIVLADQLPGVGRERLMRDMNAWGYSFRLGSAQAWFERDAEDARMWLVARGLLVDPGFLPVRSPGSGAVVDPPDTLGDWGIITGGGT